MKEYILNDICNLITDGSHYSPTDEIAGYPMLSVKDMDENDFDFSHCKHVGKEEFEKLVSNGCKPQINDVVVAKDGSYLKTAFPIKEEREIALLSSIAILRPDIGKVIPTYLSYFLKSESVYRMVSLNYISGTALKRVILKGLKRIPISLPSIEEQIERVARLESARQIIHMRKEQLILFDELIKARFVEMFGDCKSFETLGNEDIYISDGNYSSKYPTADEFIEGGVPFIRASNMVDNTIIDNEMYFISEAKHAELKKGHVKPYDVLIATRGAGIGKIAVVPERHDDSNINAQIVLLRCNKEKCNPFYLSWYLKMQETQNRIQGLVSGSAQPQLPVKRLIQLEILRADINMQNEFAEFVKQVDKSKSVVQKSLVEVQLLFDSLMQKYFG